MAELMAVITKIIEHVITRLSNRGRLFISVTIIILSCTILYVFESWTGWNYYNNLEKRVELIRDLQNIANNGVAQNNDLYPIYRHAIEDLSKREILVITFPTYSALNINSISTWKAMTGAGLWFTIAIFGLFGAFGENNKIIGAITFTVFGVIFGWLGMIIPTLYKPWVNYIFYPIIQIVFLVLLGKIIRKNRREIVEKR